MTDDAKIIAYAESPTAYAIDAFAALGLNIAPCQLAFVTLIAPALLAVANGTTPPLGRHWLEAVKGWGKSLLLAVLITWLLAFSDRTQTIQVGAKDFDQADEVRRWCQAIHRAMRFLSAKITITNARLTCKKSGSTCDFLTADASGGGAHGSRPTLLILDEIVHIDREEFAQALLDNAAKMPDGVVLCSTNAGWMSTWQFTLREIARKLSEVWTFTQWTETPPHQNKAHVEEARLRRTLSQFLRLFRGIWSAGTGDALDPADIIFDPKLKPMEGRERGFGFIGGLDLGIRHDRSALVILACHAKTQRIRLAACKAWAPEPATGKVDLLAVEEAVCAASKTFGCPVNYDPFQAELMAQRATRRGCKMIEIPFVGQNLNRMASDLVDVFRSRRIDLYEEPDLIRDLGRITIVERGYGLKLESTRDAAGHADRATAMALALIGVEDAMAVQTEPWQPLTGPHKKRVDTSGPVYHEQPRPGGWLSGFRPGPGGF